MVSLFFYGADDEARPSKAKAFAGTHAGTETIHRIVSICFANCLVRALQYTTIKKDTIKNGVFFYGADDEARPSKAKAFAGTHAGTETIHRIVSICFANCLVRALQYTTIKKDTIKNGVFFYGADDEARTRYLNLGKVALYRVSYIRKCKSNYTQSVWLCQDFF